MRPELNWQATGVPGTSATGVFSVEVDLQCARENWATIHVLRWAINQRGHAVNKTCTCSSCPKGANTRPWPTSAELQDAGAPKNVPREDVAPPSNVSQDEAGEPAESSQDPSEAPEASTPVEPVQAPPERVASPAPFRPAQPPQPAQPAQTLAERLAASGGAQTLAERLAQSGNVPPAQTLAERLASSEPD